MGRRRVSKKRTSKFDKEKCGTCVFRARCSTGSDAAVYGTMCNYACVTKSSCLKRTDSGTVIDIRGEDYYNCQCYKKGDPIEKRRWGLA